MAASLTGRLCERPLEAFNSHTFAASELHTCCKLACVLFASVFAHGTQLTHVHRFATLQTRTGPWRCSCPSAGSKGRRIPSSSSSSNLHLAPQATAPGRPLLALGCCPSSCGHPPVPVPRALHLQPARQGQAPQVWLTMPPLWSAPPQAVLQKWLLHYLLAQHRDRARLCRWLAP